MFLQTMLTTLPYTQNSKWRKYLRTGKNAIAEKLFQWFYNNVIKANPKSVTF